MHTTMTTSPTSQYPISILIDELKHEDPQLRLNSIRRLNHIAQALGSERTRGELIPFLSESSMDDEDDILLALAQQLGDFQKYIGGIEHSNVLLEPLEQLSRVEESQVRDAATKSIAKIFANIHSEAKVKQWGVSLIQRLAEEKEWLTARASACALFAPIYPLLSDESEKRKLRQLYAALSRDETPLVRRSAATNFNDFAKKVDAEHVKSDLVPLFIDMGKDDQDSVRLLTIENCVALAQVLDSRDAQTHVLPAVKVCSQDKSWRVRYMVADHFQHICEALGSDLTRRELIQSFIKLCQDTEVEVRTAAAFHVTDVARLIPKEQIIADIIPCVKVLVNDKSEHVRASLAKVIMGLAPLLSKENTIDNLLPFFLKLLKDVNSDVRLNIISELESVNKVIGVDMLAQSLLPAIVELGKDKNWRVRYAIIQKIPLLASQLGQKFFDEKLSDLYMTWLTDSACAIREAATENLRKLTETFGSEWAKNTLLPKILSMSSFPNYLYRMTTLFSVSALCEVVSPQIINDVILDEVLKMVNDRVPNVRFNVAKTLQTMIPHLDSGIVSEKIRPSLEQLKQDSDPDVKAFAIEALSHT
mmetsp:Transcript_3983/g.15041  ORF Transcript_3983/g.15041 Transcript_3983/m.15041 type:complete len:589 (-) Transcript_3983:1183-2949(-)